MDFYRNTFKLLVFYGLLFKAMFACAFLDEFELTLEQPTFILPQFTGPYREREASIAPEEYEMAEELRTLLESDDKNLVLNRLESYYDIELSPAMLTLKAQVYFSIKKFDQAEETYLAVLDRMPQLVRVHSDLGQLYLLKKDFKKAREYFANAVAFGANEAMIHGQLAYLNMQEFGPFSAITGYQQALALEPNNRSWQQGLLSALTRAEMFDAAEALVGELIEKNRNDSNLWLMKAAISMRANKTQHALASLEVAIHLGEGSQNNLRSAAQLHLQQGSYLRAIQLLKDSLELDGIGIATVNEYMFWLSELELWQQADDLLSHASSRLPLSSSDAKSQFHWHRAQTFSKLKQSEKAYQHFQTALDLNPNNGMALLDFARFQKAQDNIEQAELLFIRAEALDGSKKDAILGRAELYLSRKDFESALIQLRNAHLRYPELAALKENIEIVENIIRTQKLNR